MYSPPHPHPHPHLPPNQYLHPEPPGHRPGPGMTIDPAGCLRYADNGHTTRQDTRGLLGFRTHYGWKGVYISTGAEPGAFGVDLLLFLQELDGGVAERMQRTVDRLVWVSEHNTHNQTGNRSTLRDPIEVLTSLRDQVRMTLPDATSFYCSPDCDFAWILDFRSSRLDVHYWPQSHDSVSNSTSPAIPEVLASSFTNYSLSFLEQLCIRQEPDLSSTEEGSSSSIELEDPDCIMRPTRFTFGYGNADPVDVFSLFPEDVGDEQSGAVAGTKRALGDTSATPEPEKEPYLAPFYPFKRDYRRSARQEVSQEYLDDQNALASPLEGLFIMNRNKIMKMEPDESVDSVVDREPYRIIVPSTYESSQSTLHAPQCSLNTTPRRRSRSNFGHRVQRATSMSRPLTPVSQETAITRTGSTTSAPEARNDKTISAPPTPTSKQSKDQDATFSPILLLPALDSPKKVKPKKTLTPAPVPSLPSTPKPDTNRLSVLNYTFGSVSPRRRRTSPPSASFGKSSGASLTTSASVANLHSYTCATYSSRESNDQGRSWTSTTEGSTAPCRGHTKGGRDVFDSETNFGTPSRLVTEEAGRGLKHSETLTALDRIGETIRRSFSSDALRNVFRSSRQRAQVS